MRWLMVFLVSGCFTSSPNVCTSVTSADLDRGAQDTAQGVPVENGSALWIGGTLSNDAPEAWYSWHAVAGVLSTVDPFVKVQQSGLVVCAYMNCQFGPCPGGTYADVAPNGQPGCCAATPIEFQIYGCGNDTVDAWMSVTSPRSQTARVCETYKLGYNW